MRQNHRSSTLIRNSYHSECGFNGICEQFSSKPDDSFKLFGTEIAEIYPHHLDG